MSAWLLFSIAFLFLILIPFESSPFLVETLRGS